MKKIESAPDFFCIGAPRAGTSWLFENLKKHPQIWLPYIKEIHYFDREKKYTSPSFLNERKPLKRINSLSFQKKAFHDIKSGIKKGDLNIIKWYLKFYFGYYNDTWYKSLFKEGKDKVKGEITPAYSLLEEQDVDKISSLFPDLKVIYILRNPIYRTWSAIRRKRNIKLSFSSFLKLVNSKPIEERVDYINNLKNWQKFYPKENIFIGFYDELNHNPDIFLSKIYTFLGVEYNPSIIKSRIYAAPEQKLPKEYKRYLKDKYSGLIQQLDEKFQNEYTKNWLKDL